MKLKLYIIDEVNAKLEGLGVDDAIDIVEAMKLPIKGAYSTPAVQLGISDGKEPLFTEDGFFYLNQLDEVIGLLEELGYKEDDIQIEDIREAIQHPVEESELPEIHRDMFSEYGVELWDHQIEFFEKFIRVDKGIYDASTSSGKTLCLAGTAKLYEPYYPSLSITINEKLVNDAAKMMDKLGMDYVVIDSKVPPKKRGELIKKHRHVITTRKLAINMAKHLEGFFGVLIVDETHILGDSFFDFGTKTLAECPIRLGLTGSLPEKSQDPLKRMKIMNMIGGGIFAEVLPSYLMEKGYAATLDVRVVKLQDNIGLHKQTEAGKLWDWEMEEAHYNRCPERIEAIGDFIINNCPRNTLIICRPEMGKALAEYIGCDFVDGDTPVEERESYYAMFDERDDYTLAASFGTSGTGLSIDLIHYGVLIDVGSNPARAGQSIGRFLRKDNEGDLKDSAVVWDIYSNTKYGEKQKRERMKYFKKRGFSVRDKYETINVW